LKILLSIVWGVSGALQNFALLAMLVGVFLVGWAVVRHLHENEHAVSSAVPRAVWASPGTKIGTTLFFTGLALDTLSIVVRLLLPGRL
jgi:hypothetical protein